MRTLHLQLLAAAALFAAASPAQAQAQVYGVSVGIQTGVYSTSGPGIFTQPAWYTHPYAVPVAYTPHTVLMRNDLPRRHYRYPRKHGFYAGGHAPRHFYVNNYNGYAPQYGYYGPAHGYYPY